MKLDNDTLLLVFLCLKGRSNPEFTTARRISHVCRRWRTLAVKHCPQLWQPHALRVPRSPQGLRSFKDGKLTDFNREMVRRCRDLDLEFGFDEIIRYTSGIGTLHDYSKKIASLYLCRPSDWGDSTAAKHGWELLHACHCPRLKHLELSSFDCNFSNVPFNKNLSSLVSLILRNTWMDVEKMKMGKKLKVLIVQGVRSTLTPTFKHWLKILGSFPNLTSLELSFTLSYSLPPTPQTLLLQHLRELELTLSSFQLEYFLDNVSIPACKKIHLDVALNDDNLEFPSAERIKQIATRHIAPCDTGSRMRIIDHASKFSCVLTPADTPDEWDTNYNIYLTLRVRNGQLHRFNLASMLPGWLSVGEHITVLSFPPHTQSQNIQPKAWVDDFIRNLTNLRKISCSHETFGTWQQELFSDSDGQGTEGDVGGRLPTLEVIQNLQGY